MRHFGYTWFVPRDPFEFVPPAMTCRDMGAMYDDYINHLIPNESQSVVALSD